MQMISIYNKSKNPNLRYGFLLNFCGIKFILYRSAKGRHIVTCDAMQELVMLDKTATVIDLRKELVKIVDSIYQHRKNKPAVIFKDNGGSVEVIESKGKRYFCYAGESMPID